MFSRLASLACVVCPAVVAVSLVGCHPMPGPSTGARARHVPTIRRETSFVPAPNVNGSRLATDRAVKIAGADEDAMSALGGVKLGVLHVHVVDRVDPTEDQWAEKMMWPGASVDAAALGATHARKLSLAPRPAPLDCGRHRDTACDIRVLTTAVTASYELWHVEPDRWAELPENLRPKALPASAIRDVQPGNWVRPPPVVTVKSD